jgi:chitinase
MFLPSAGATPIKDTTAAVNYMVYGKDNWISYDDRETFQEKIDFANDRGLSGILIWAIDLDNQNLDALKTVSGKQDLRRGIKDSQVFTDFSAKDSCYITDCGGMVAPKKPITSRVIGIDMGSRFLQEWI